MRSQSTSTRTQPAPVAAIPLSSPSAKPHHRFVEETTAFGEARSITVCRDRHGAARREDRRGDDDGTGPERAPSQPTGPR